MDEVQKFHAWLEAMGCHDLDTYAKKVRLKLVRRFPSAKPRAETVRAAFVDPDTFELVIFDTIETRVAIPNRPANTDEKLHPQRTGATGARRCPKGAGGRASVGLVRAHSAMGGVPVTPPPSMTQRIQE